MLLSCAADETLLATRVTSILVVWHLELLRSAHGSKSGLIKGLLTRDPKKRLGGGHEGVLYSDQLDDESAEFAHDLCKVTPN